MLTPKQQLKVMLMNQHMRSVDQMLDMPKLRRSIPVSPRTLERHLRTAFYAGRKAAWEFYNQSKCLKRMPPEWAFRTNPSITKLLKKTGVTRSRTKANNQE